MITKTFTPESGGPGQSLVIMKAGVGRGAARHHGWVVHIALVTLVVGAYDEAIRPS